MKSEKLKFGEFVEKKRLEKGITLRGLARMLDIAPAYMSDIEKGRRYPPDKEKLLEIASHLVLSEDEKNYMFDLAALEKTNSVSPDLPEYIMETDNARVALRLARDNKVTNDDWKEIIKILNKKGSDK